MVLRKLLLIAVITLPFSQVSAQNWHWIKSQDVCSGYPYPSVIGEIALSPQSISGDNSGNVYLTGYFFDSNVTFGTTTLTNPDTSQQNPTFYAVKYNSEGDVIWAKGGFDYSGLLYADAKATEAGHLYFLGYDAQDTSIHIGPISLVNTGQFDGHFLAKSDSNGNFLWAKNIVAITGAATCDLRAITVDASEDVFVAGVFNVDSLGASAKFDTDSFSFISTGHYIFSAKYDSAGSLLWVKYSTKTSGLSHDEIKAIAADRWGNAYVTGLLDDSIAFDGININHERRINILVVKYNAAGEAEWAKSIGGLSLAMGYSISPDIYGNLYITGSFVDGGFTFGSSTVHTDYNEVILLKFDTSGNELWARSSISGTLQNYNYGGFVGTDTLGNIFLSGNFDSRFILFGTDTIVKLATGSEKLNSFLVKYDSAGNYIWSKSIRDTGLEYVSSFFIPGNSSNCGYIAGGAKSANVYFDNVSMPAECNIFLAKFDMAALSSEQIQLPGDKVLIYPNPTTNLLTVHYSENIEKLAIYDLLGQIILSKTGNAREETIDVATLPEGIYLLKINGSHTQKFVKL